MAALGFLANDGDTAELQGSGKNPYILKNTNGVFSCSCPAWRNQSLAIDIRTCKHLITYLGIEHEIARGAVIPDKFRGATVGKAPVTPKVEVIPPPLALGENWTDQPIVGRYSSEKLDGLRALLKDGKLYSRNGNVFQAPQWYLDDLPKATLDGELWMKRGGFQETTSVVRSKNAGDKWKNVFFMVFDAPDWRLSWLSRQSELKALTEGHMKLGELRRLSTRAFLLPQVEITSVEHLNEELDKVLAKGGEGLMLADPNADYVARRTTNLLKVKKFQSGEAVVLAHNEGQGRHVGVMGALSVTALINDEQRVFKVGSGFTDKQRREAEVLYPIGTLIKYRYFEITKDGVPRFPTFIEAV